MTPMRALLTGTAWHFAASGFHNASYGNSGGTACERSCSPRGVCTLLHDAVPNLARCDCGPYAWSETCAVPVVKPKRTCVRNDSAPWLCEVPACLFEAAEVHVIGTASRVCKGVPLALCPMSCHGRGSCVLSAGAHPRCECFDGFFGRVCQHVTPADCVRNCTARGECLRGFCLCTPPFSGIDCSIDPSHSTRCLTPPCIYVYELPARMNVLGRKSYYTWRSEGDFKYRAPMLMLESLLDSPHRTTVAAEADYFYVPVWEWEGCWGPNEALYRAHRYVSTVFPFWNRSEGLDHIWFVSRDVGSCDTPWGSLREELGVSVVLQHWGGLTGLQGKLSERCFLMGHDLVVPAAVRAFKLMQSPFWYGVDELLAPHAPPSRTVELFFFGALCWRTFKKVSTMEQLVDKCNKSMLGGGRNNPVAKYGFGLRFEIWRRFRELPGYHLYASDFQPSHNAAFVVDVNHEMLRAKYCLCPSGSGWGMRAVHSIILGCVPVIVQHDGENMPVVQPFEHEFLNWDHFAVLVRHNQVPDLDKILKRTDLARKQAQLRSVWTRMVWRRWLPELQRSKLPGPDAFETIMEVLLARVQSPSQKNLSLGAQSTTSGKI